MATAAAGRGATRLSGCGERRVARAAAGVAMGGSDSGSDGELAAELPLSVQFARCRAAHEALEASPPPLRPCAAQDAARSAAKALLALARGIERAALFSSNETIDEVATNDIKYLLVTPYVAAAYARLRADDGEGAAEAGAREGTGRSDGNHAREAPATGGFGGDRTPLLTESMRLHRSFVEQCDRLGVVPEESAAAARRGADDAADPATRRAEKIARHRRERATREALDALRARRRAREDADEEVDDGVREGEERELRLLELDAELHRSIEATRALGMELEMLQHARARGLTPGTGPAIPAGAPLPPWAIGDAQAASMAGGGGPGRGGGAPAAPPPDALTHSASALASAANDRERLRAGVFRPSHALPTMTLEEFAEQEVADMRRREEESKKAEAAREAIDLEREDHHDREQERLRKWDDWKDDNKRGSGNMRGRS